MRTAGGVWAAALAALLAMSIGGCRAAVCDRNGNVIDFANLTPQQQIDMILANNITFCGPAPQPTEGDIGEAGEDGEGADTTQVPLPTDGGDIGEAEVSTAEAETTTLAATTAAGSTAAPTPACATDPHCASCSFANNGMCTLCGNSKYLHEGRCLDSCAGTGRLAWGTAETGRVCTGDFVCDEVATAGKCLCPNDQTKADCTRCSVAVLNETSFRATCTRCGNPARWIVAGKCENEIVCLNSAIVGANAANTHDNKTCSCLHTAGTNCRQCTLDFRGRNDVCTKCKGCKYLSQGQCVDEDQCPAGQVPTPVGNCFDRFCSEPFNCTENKRSLGGRCRCPARCLECEYRLNGQIACKRCSNGYFLHNEACVQKCPDGYANVGAARKEDGRFCYQGQFVCDKLGSLTTEGRNSCVCSTARCGTCTYAVNNAVGKDTCNTCRPKLYYYAAGPSCRSSCPTGFVANDATKTCDVAI